MMDMRARLKTSRFDGNHVFMIQWYANGNEEITSITILGLPAGKLWIGVDVGGWARVPSC
jgi:hypothetical protein